MTIHTIPFRALDPRPRPNRGRVCLLDYLSADHLNRFAPHRPGDVIEINGQPHIIRKITAKQSDGRWVWQITADPVQAAPDGAQECI